MTALLGVDRLSRGRALRRLAPILRTHPIGVALTTVTAAASLAAGIGAAVAAAWLTGQVAAGDADLTAGLIVLAVCVVAKGAFAWAESWVAHDMAYRVMCDLRSDVFDGLERLAPGWLSGKRTGDVASAAVGDVEALEWFYAHTIAQSAVLVGAPLVTVGVLATIEARLALVLIPFVVLLLSVPFWLIRRGDREGVELRTRLAALHADAVDGVAGLRELAVFGAEERQRQRLLTTGKTLGRAQRANASRAGIENGVTDALVAGAMLAVLTVGALLVADGSLPGASYPVAVILAGFSLSPLTTVVGGIRNLGVLRATASRVLEVVDTPARVTDRPDAHDRPLDAAPEIRFEQVSFGYGADDVLHEVTFSVPSGRTVALVGASGAGKSTCAHLLLRFWEPDSGAITLDGVDLRDLGQAAVRSRVALVPQDGYLFNESIADNIRLGRGDATDEEVADAARRALVTEFTDRLPDGLDTVVGERGAALSGGQRQRVALARALLRNASVLVLDEAVSNVDAEGEVVLRRALDAARTGRTTLIIAHRLSTIAGTDHVVVLDRGRVVEEGTHDGLLAAGGSYQRLIGRQVEPR